MKVPEQLPGNSASVIDGMHLVQRVTGDQVTFGDVATTVLSMALREVAESDRIDAVFDTYRDNTIKNCERILRCGEAGHQMQSITGTQLLRQWRHFLSTVNNMTSIISFIVSEWRKPNHITWQQRSDIDLGST